MFISIRENVISFICHTIDPINFIRMKGQTCKCVLCAFLPDTLNGGIQLPKLAFSLFKRYVVRFYKTADYLVVNPMFMSSLSLWDT